MQAFGLNGKGLSNMEFPGQFWQFAMRIALIPMVQFINSAMRPEFLESDGYGSLRHRQH